MKSGETRCKEPIRQYVLTIPVRRADGSDLGLRSYSYSSNPLMVRWPRFGCGGAIGLFADGNQTGDTEERADEAANEDFDGVIFAEPNDELMLGQIEMPPIRIGNFGDARRCEGAIHQMKAARNPRSQQDRLNAGDDIGSLPAVRASGQIN